VTGQDDNSKTLMEGCRDAGIEAGFIATDSERVTTTKVRIVTERNQQVARVDYEHDAEITGEVEHGLVGAIRTHGGDASAIIVSDYLKGLRHERVMAAHRRRAAARDPAARRPEDSAHRLLRGRTVITPNHHEAEIATHMRIRIGDERGARPRVSRAARCDAVLMTRGDQGMWLLARGRGPAAGSAREVADVTGAGDTVIATLALAMAAGATLLEAARLANEAAGIAVGKFGAATVTPAELLRAISVEADA
jgi:D-beta-D-heptose 7-phosphate kinase/D-beta-D-heptose 1-phosphate adenosyltransferase